MLWCLFLQGCASALWIINSLVLKEEKVNISVVGAVFTQAYECVFSPIRVVGGTAWVNLVTAAVIFRTCFGFTISGWRENGRKWDQQKTSKRSFWCLRGGWCSVVSTRIQLLDEHQRKQLESGDQGLAICAWQEQKASARRTWHLLWCALKKSYIYFSHLIGRTALPKLHWFSFWPKNV